MHLEADKMLIKSKRLDIDIPDSYTSAAGYAEANANSNLTSDLLKTVGDAIAPLAKKRDIQIGNEMADAAINEAMAQDTFVNPGQSGLFDLGRGEAYRERTEKFNTYIGDTMLESFYTTASQEAAYPKLRSTAMFNFADNVEKMISKVDDMGGDSAYKEQLKNQLRVAGHRRLKQLSGDIDALEQKENAASVQMTLSNRLTHYANENNGATSVEGRNAAVNLLLQERDYVQNETGVLVDIQPTIDKLDKHTFQNVELSIVLEAEKDTQVFINSDGRLDTDKLGASIETALAKYVENGEALNQNITDEDKLKFKNKLIISMFTANTRSLFEGPFAAMDMTEVYDDATFTARLQQTKAANEEMRQQYLSLFGDDLAARADFLSESEKLSNAMESEINGRYVTAKEDKSNANDTEKSNAYTDYKTAKRSVEAALAGNRQPTQDDLEVIKSAAYDESGTFSPSQVATARDLYENVYVPKGAALDIVLNQAPNADRAAAVNLVMQTKGLNDGQKKSAVDQAHAVYDGDAEKGKTANRIELKTGKESPTFNDALISAGGNYTTAFANFIAARGEINDGKFYAKEGDTAAIQATLEGIKDPQVKAMFLQSVIGSTVFMDSIRELNLDGNNYFGSVAFVKDLGIMETENYVNPEVLKGYTAIPEVAAAIAKYKPVIQSSFLEGAGAPSQYGNGIINMLLRKQASTDPAKWKDTVSALEEDLKRYSKAMPIINGVIQEDFRGYLGVFDFMDAQAEQAAAPPSQQTARVGFGAPTVQQRQAPELGTPMTSLRGLEIVDTPEELVAQSIDTFIDQDDVPADMVGSIAGMLKSESYQFKYNETGGGKTQYVAVDANGDLLQYTKTDANGNSYNTPITFTIRSPQYYRDMATQGQ